MITHTIDSYQSQFKTRQSRSYKFYNLLPKFQILQFCKNNYTRHIFWSCLIRCVNMKWMGLVLSKLQSAHVSVHRRTDRWRKTSIPPFQLRWSRGHNDIPVSCCLHVWPRRGLMILYIIECHKWHYNDAILSMMASQVTSLTIVYSSVYSGTDQRKHQSSESLAFVRGIHQWPVNSMHKGPVKWKKFPFDNVIMEWVSD